MLEILFLYIILYFHKKKIFCSFCSRKCKFVSAISIMPYLMYRMRQGKKGNRLFCLIFFFFLECSGARFSAILLNEMRGGLVDRTGDDQSPGLTWLKESHTRKTQRSQSKYKNRDVFQTMNFIQYFSSFFISEIYF